MTGTHGYIRPKKKPSRVWQPTAGLKGITMSEDDPEVIIILPEGERVSPKRRRVPPRCYSPVDFDEKKCLPKHLWRYAEDARYVLGLILWQTLMRFPKEVRKNADPGVELKAAYLRDTMTCKDRYRKVLDALEKSGAIRCDHHYVEGRKCHTYWLGDLFSRKYETHIFTKTALVANLVRREKKEVADLTLLHQWLRDRLFLLDIDDMAAMKHLAGDPNAHLFALQVMAIKDKSPIRYDRDEYGRVHTNLTNLPSDLRQFLRLDGSPLVNLDIANSQPMFLGLVLHAPIGLKVPKGELSPEKQKLLQLLDPYSIPNQPLLPPTPLRSRIIKMDEKVVGEYLDCCCRGQLYETLGACVGLSREEAKAGVLHALYCDTAKWKKRRKALEEQYPETAKTFKAFDQLYPGLMKAVESWKRGDYTRLPKAMQRLESYVVFQMICERVRRERPDTWLATIHDSILCHPRDADYIRSVMLDEFSSIGATPTIKRQDYGGSPS